MKNSRLGRRVRRVLGVLLLVGCAATDSGTAAPLGDWGSSTASLTTQDSTARMLLSTSDCYAAYADIAQRVPLGNFSLTGTFTQLTGVAPGSIQYPAQYSGTATNSTISILITLPTQGEQIGPLTLTFGVVKSWEPCAFP
jgi:hypothetical protein